MRELRKRSQDTDLFDIYPLLNNGDCVEIDAHREVHLRDAADCKCFTYRHHTYGRLIWKI